MIHRLAFALIAASILPPSPVRAQAGTETHREAAALARVLAPTRFGESRSEVLAVEQVRDMIEDQLLRRGDRGPRPCDPDNQDCRRVAHEIAVREAPGLHARVTRLLEAVYANYFERTMTVADMRAARAFFEGPAGRRFAGTMGGLFGFRPEPRAAREAMDAARVQGEAYMASARATMEEFDNRTRHLPRQPPPGIPMTPRYDPPAPPPPPR